MLDSDIDELKMSNKGANQPAYSQHTDAHVYHDAPGPMVHFSEVHPSATDEYIASLFGTHGEVLKVVKTMAHSDHGQGLHCSGHVVMSNEHDAQAAVQRLNGKVKCPGMANPMVATIRKTSDSSGSDSVPLSQLHGLLLQQPSVPGSGDAIRIEQPHQVQQQNWQQLQSLLASSSMPARAPAIPSPPAPARQSAHLRDGVPATPAEVVAAMSEYMSRPNRPKPPAGCAADAVKLFVGNIPKHCTEAVLHKVFQCYGVIIEIAVVRHPITTGGSTARYHLLHVYTPDVCMLARMRCFEAEYKHKHWLLQTRNRHSAESKGSAFVWYSTCMEAARAILSLHSRYTFPDAKGDHVRLVTVRPAVKSQKAQPPPVLGFGDPAARALPGMHYGHAMPTIATLQQQLDNWASHQPQGHIDQGYPPGVVPQMALPGRPRRHTEPHGHAFQGQLAPPQYTAALQYEGMPGWQAATPQGQVQGLPGWGGGLGPQHAPAPAMPTPSESMFQQQILQAMANMSLTQHGENGMRPKSASLGHGFNGSHTGLDHPETSPASDVRHDLGQ